MNLAEVDEASTPRHPIAQPVRQSAVNENLADINDQRKLLSEKS
jgi:hypothetical protein